MLILLRDIVQNGTGHFTQVVWKKSVLLGVGMATDGTDYYVCAHYGPAGNYSGQYAENVLPIAAGYRLPDPEELSESVGHGRRPAQQATAAGCRFPDPEKLSESVGHGTDPAQQAKCTECVCQ